MSSQITNTPSADVLTGFYSYTDTLKGVYYGPGCVNDALPKLLATIGSTKALIVTGKSLREKTDVISRIETILKEHNAYGATLSEIGEHAPVSGIHNGVKLFNEIQADVFVAVGGGSPVDAAKAMSYFIQQQRGGSFVKQIAIPTTLSAAEYTAGVGYTNEEGQKTVLMSPFLPPAGVILDAELTITTPERLWLSSGIRALDHAVEGLYRPLLALPAKVLGYAALADLFKYLPESKANPKDLAARQKLQVAAWMSLWPIKTERPSPLGLSHALGHKLGATYGIPHGITSCLTLASVIQYKAETAPEEDKRSLAEALFYLQEPSTGTLDGDVKKLAFRIDGLVKRLGLSTSLEENKVPKADLAKIAKLALGEDQSTHPQVVELLENIYSKRGL
ncbi:Dehydroquinate synthase-like protein [Coniophora puteana RWD-64-598 SS2]|uniref:Dehydroquinate synthase-like protein n=1 Tax=Coniophora puteana (strain RWD-64-598) TaxID=741705 RepID=A0A5M3MVT8_CONPW|nr:Dehydroquinate synthase-like protein [Coniophora puteana RWD-64-598 SS2]EIW83160.1 Dehydroquinate synthase-like protein [Coniophora puteana RWD-64-598 SS2]